MRLLRRNEIGPVDRFETLDGGCLEKVEVIIGPVPQDIQPIGNQRRLETRREQAPDLPLVFPNEGQLRSVRRATQSQGRLHVTQGFQTGNIVSRQIDIRQKRLQPGSTKRNFSQTQRGDGANPPSTPWLRRDETLVRQTAERRSNDPAPKPIGIAKNLFGEPLTRRKLTELDRVANPVLGDRNEIAGALGKKGTLMVEHIVKLTSQFSKLKSQICYSSSFL